MCLKGQKTIATQKKSFKMQWITEIIILASKLHICFQLKVQPLSKCPHSVSIFFLWEQHCLWKHMKYFNIMFSLTKIQTFPLLEYTYVTRWWLLWVWRTDCLIWKSRTSSLYDKNNGIILFTDISLNSRTHANIFTFIGIHVWVSDSSAFFI